MPMPGKVNQTSARFLISAIAEGDDQRRINLAFDVFIKARRYSILNKICFNIAMLGGLLLIAWPVVVLTDIWASEIFRSPLLQTSLTAFTGLAVFIYTHYKRKQMLAENLLRTIAFSDMPIGELSELVIQEMAKIDLGLPLGEKFSPKQD